MGELIFLRGTKQEPIKDTKSSDGSAVISILENLGDILSSSGVKVDLGIIFLQIEGYLRSLQRKPSKHSIATARGMFQNYSDEDIEAVARTSTQQQWGARPGYFQALVDEYHTRQKHSPA